MAALQFSRADVIMQTDGAPTTQQHQHLQPQINVLNKDLLFLQLWQDQYT